MDCIIILLKAILSIINEHSNNRICLRWERIAQKAMSQNNIISAEKAHEFAKEYRHG